MLVRRLINRDTTLPTRDQHVGLVACQAEPPATVEAADIAEGSLLCEHQADSSDREASVRAATSASWLVDWPRRDLTAPDRKVRSDDVDERQPPCWSLLQNRYRACARRCQWMSVCVSVCEIEKEVRKDKRVVTSERSQGLIKGGDLHLARTMTNMYKNGRRTSTPIWHLHSYQAPLTHPCAGGRERVLGGSGEAMITKKDVLREVSVHEVFWNAKLQRSVEHSACDINWIELEPQQVELLTSRCRTHHRRDNCVRFGIFFFIIISKWQNYVVQRTSDTRFVTNAANTTLHQRLSQAVNKNAAKMRWFKEGNSCKITFKN